MTCDHNTMKNVYQCADCGYIYAQGCTPENVKSLIEALKNVIGCLEQHLKDDAKREGVTVETLCPCWTTELEAAKTALIKAGVTA